MNEEHREKWSVSEMMQLISLYLRSQKLDLSSNLKPQKLGVM